MYIVGNIIKGLVAIAMLVAVGVAAFFIYRYASSALGSSGPPKGQPVIVVISPGESVSTIADTLKDAGVLEKGGLIDSSLYFKAQLKARGAEGKIKAGRFELTTGMDVDELIDTLVNTAGTAGLRFQVIEGKRLEEVASTLAAQGIVSETRFLDLAKRPEGAAQFQSDLLAGSGKPGDQGLEGYLFPDTYEIEYKEGDNSQEIITVMLRAMERKLTPDLLDAIAARGRTLHEVLTIASIVQREGVVKEELPRISSVFWNRIDNEMRLDADPTVQYAAGAPPDWWRVIDFAPRSLDHPYNTYVVPGLPPGPICSSSELAIRAAIFPEDTPYLYFVAKGDGSGLHVFAETLEEHERNRIEQGNIR